MILETFTDTWNFTFLIMASISVLMGTCITIRKIKKEELERRREKRNTSDETNDKETKEFIDKIKANQNENKMNTDLNKTLDDSGDNE